MSVYPNEHLTVTIEPYWYYQHFDIPINYPYEVKQRYLRRFIKTKRWEDILNYTFLLLMESPTPYYGDIVYDLKDIQTSITNTNRIQVKGIFKKRSLRQIRELYDRETAINRTWSDHGNQYLRHETVKERVYEALYKICQEGELYILDLPGGVLLTAESYNWSAT